MRVSLSFAASVCRVTGHNYARRPFHTEVASFRGRNCFAVEYSPLSLLLSSRLQRASPSTARIQVGSSVAPEPLPSTQSIYLFVLLQPGDAIALGVCSPHLDFCLFQVLQWATIILATITARFKRASTIDQCHRTLFTTPNATLQLRDTSRTSIPTLTEVGKGILSHLAGCSTIIGAIEQEPEIRPLVANDIHHKLTRLRPLSWPYQIVGPRLGFTVISISISTDIFGIERAFP